MTDDLGLFAKAGFRAFSLSGPGWTIVLSRVNVSDMEPRGLFTVFAPGEPGAFADLGGRVLSRQTGLFGGTNLSGLSKDLASRLRGDPSIWARRLDYLAARVVQDGTPPGSTEDFVGVPTKPDVPAFVFDRRVRKGRTISLFGPGSAGKTTIADALLVSLATGREIIPGWVPVRAFEVGTLDWDEGSEETRVRLHAICNAYGLELRGYHYQHLTRPLADCADSAGRWCLDKGVEVLCISPVNRAIRPTSGDPGGPVHELYEVLAEFGTTNLLIDHVVGSAIGSQRIASRAYGSVAKVDDSRGSYSVYEQSSEPGKRVVVIRNPKAPSLSPARAPQAVRIEFTPPWPDEAEAYDEIRFGEDVIVEAQEETKPKRETQTGRLVRILSEQGPMSATDLAAIGGFDAKRIRKIAFNAKTVERVTIRHGADGLYSIVEDDDALGL
jgi:hypothetical protein